MRQRNRKVVGNLMINDGSPLGFERRPNASVRSEEVRGDVGAIAGTYLAIVSPTYCYCYNLQTYLMGHCKAIFLQLTYNGTPVTRAVTIAKFYCQIRKLFHTIF